MSPHVSGGHPPPEVKSVLAAARRYLLTGKQEVLSTALSLYSPRCGGCRWARYQSRDAQKAAWADGHKQECAALRASDPRAPPASVRLAARVFWSQHRCLACHWAQALPQTVAHQHG